MAARGELHISIMIRLALVTSEGEFIASYSMKGLAKLSFPSGRSQAVMEESAASAEVRQWHRLATAAVNTGLTGRAPVALPPLDLSGGTKFQQSVWAALRKIKLGQTQSYGEIAAALGNPRAVRAVGGACGANPLPVLVPCHRVLAAKQKIGGFSGGLDWKRKLLQIEGIILS